MSNNNPKIGILNEDVGSNHFYMNDIMHSFNSNQRKVTSYKFAFFKCILDNLFNVTLDEKYLYLSFDYLSYSFSKIYWNLASKYNLPQIHNGRESAMVKAFKKVKSTYPHVIFDGVDFDVLSDVYKNEYLKLTKKQIKLDVLFALFSDFNRNIYGYNEKEEYIYFSKNTYEFLLDYKDALEKIDYYSWIRWTENILSLANKNISNLSKNLMKLLLESP